MITDPTIEKLRAMRLSGMANALLEQMHEPAARKLDYFMRACHSWASSA